MSAGVVQFERWLEDLVVFGLATLEQDPHQSLEPIAASLTDSQLPTAAQWVRSWISRVGEAVDWAERLAADMGHWHHLNLLFLRPAALDVTRFAGVVLAYGHRVQAAKLPTLGQLVQDRWSCVGIVEGSEGPLNFRHTHFVGTQPDHRATMHSYAYNAELPATQLVVGQSALMPMRVYPDGLPGRVAWPTAEELPDGAPTMQLSVEQPHALSDWSALEHYHRELVLRQPWRQYMPVAVEQLRLRFAGTHDGSYSQILAVDAAGFAVTLIDLDVERRRAGTAATNLRELLPTQLWSLLAVLDQQQPFTLYGERRAGQLKLWSIWQRDRLMAL